MTCAIDYSGLVLLEQFNTRIVLEWQLALHPASENMRVSITYLCWFFERLRVLCVWDILASFSRV
jgi:hypothetical protein